jgi:hypothetical protein
LVRETYALPAVRSLVAEMSGPVWEAFDRALGVLVRQQSALKIDDVLVSQNNGGHYEVTVTWNTMAYGNIDWDYCVEAANDIAEKTHGRIHGSAEGRPS